MKPSGRRTSSFTASTFRTAAFLPTTSLEPKPATSRSMSSTKRRLVGDIVPVGWPVEGMEILILDKEGRLLGPGQLGEIAVKSEFMSPGYWRRPDLTAKVFFPVAGEERVRIFRTGDLGCLRSDGCVEHHGRKGLRVRIRGFGVEIEEVEEILSRHAAAKAAAVGVRDSGSGEQRLVAFVVRSSGSSVTVGEFRSHMREHLPEHMVPAAFYFVDSLPISPGGKVDRHALRELDGRRPESDTPSVEPRSPTEERLARIWSEVLRIEPISVFDKFFDVGGHSLTATQITSRIRQEFGKSLSVRDFLLRPTIAEIATAIDSGWCKPTDANPLLRRTPAVAALPLSFAQSRLWFLNQLQPENLSYNMGRAFRLRGPLNVPALRSSLEQIVLRHEVLRTAFPSTDGQPGQVISGPQPLHLECVDLSSESPGKREEKLGRILREEVRRSFDLARGPLFRPLLVRISPEEHVLCLTLHHIVSDQWSRFVMTRELTNLYEKLTTGRSSGLPEPPIQYADFALWQRQWLTGDVLESHLRYWREKLGDGIPPLELPGDRPRPAFPSFTGKRKSALLPAPLLKSLRSLCLAEGVTLYMVLLAGFQILLHRYSGQKDFAIGTPIANRTRVELENLIGFFVNTLVLRADLSGNPTCRELLKRVSATALSAYEHQDLPFEKLVEELNPGRSLTRNPLFQVMFALQNMPAQALQLAGLTMTPMELDSGAAMFDLSLGAYEGPQGLRCDIQYSEDLFDEETIERMILHYRTLPREPRRESGWSCV